MVLPSGYKFIYVDWSKEAPVFVRPETGEDVTVISTNNGTEYVDVKTFTLIYSDGEYLTGRLADGTEVNLVLTAGIGGDVILGKVITEAE